MRKVFIAMASVALIASCAKKQDEEIVQKIVEKPSERVEGNNFA